MRNGFPIGRHTLMMRTRTLSRRSASSGCAAVLVRFPQYRFNRRALVSEECDRPRSMSDNDRAYHEFLGKCFDILVIAASYSFFIDGQLRPYALDDSEWTEQLEAARGCLTWPSHWS